MGDFNIDLLKYNYFNYTNQLLVSFLLFFFIPLIIKPTRITCSTTTLIDNIFNYFEQCEHLNDVILSDIHDHPPIFSMLH